VAGHDVVRDRDRVKPLINAVFEDPNLYERFSGLDNLRLFARLYGVPASHADELLETVGLTFAATRKVKTYSSGMKQRLLVARALVNSPRVLFMDEPTRGLDPTSARELRTLVARLADGGTTVFLTTHYMEEADELCDRVAFLSQGRIVALDTPRELKLKQGERRAVVLLNDRTEHSIRLDDATDATQLDEWMRAGLVLTVHSQEGTLEDVFVALAGRAL
jgi:ABC-2 type transport system ATP-binding protein